MPRSNQARPSSPRPDAPARCYVEATLEVIAGKWKPMILWHLIQGTKRFGEVRRPMPQVTQQMLATHLRELKRDGVVHREAYAVVPPKVEYSATPLGRSLEPILVLMHEWGRAFVGASEQPGGGPA